MVQRRLHSGTEPAQAIDFLMHHTSYTPEGAGRNLALGVLAGLAGGLAGSLAMSAFSRLWSAARGAPADGQEDTFTHQGARPDVESAKKQGKTAGERSSVATTKIAEEVAEPVMERPLSKKERRVGGELVHYSYGTAAGAVYGAGVEQFPALRSGEGLLFGFLLWGVGIPTTLPALGLTAPPDRYSLKEHSFGLLSHAVYGAATELTRAQVRHWLQRADESQRPIQET